MRLFTWMIGLAVLSSVQMAHADYRNTCSPCETACEQQSWRDCCCDTEWSAYIDYLYWKVCRSDLNYSAGSNQTRYINPNYTSGFRVGARASCECLDFGFRYMRFDWSTNRKYPQFSAGEKARFKLDFDVLDLEVGFERDIACCNGTFRPFVGGKFAWSKDTFDKRDNGESKADLSHCGKGLYLGADGRMLIREWCCCERQVPVSLVARGSLGIIDTSFKVDNTESDNNRARECLYTSFYETFVGLELSFCKCSETESSLTIGYESQFWGSWREYTSDDDVASLGMGGLVVRFAAGF